MGVRTRTIFVMREFNSARKELLFVDSGAASLDDPPVACFL